MNKRVDYGLGHAAVTGVSTLVTGHLLNPWFAAGMYILLMSHWYQRERNARDRDGVVKFKDWYPDSQFGVISPAVAGAAALIYLFN